MISARKLHANRANARASTGPKTAAGKARVARNALRHGLSLPVLRDPTRLSEIESLAREIAGSDADPRRHELAYRIAEAQIDLVRVRRARQDILRGALSLSDRAKRLAFMGHYERLALSRRKFAIRAFDAARPDCDLPANTGRDFVKTKPTGKS